MRGRTPLRSVLTCIGTRDCLGQLVCSAWPFGRPALCLALFTILHLQSGHGPALPAPAARAYMQICAPGRFLET